MSAHQQPILSLLYRAAQLVEKHKSDLSIEQLTDLNHLTADVRDRLDRVSDDIQSLIFCPPSEFPWKQMEYLYLENKNWMLGRLLLYIGPQKIQNNARAHEFLRVYIE